MVDVTDNVTTQVVPTADRELLRLHRRACTDFAARMRLPAWEHLELPLAEPLESFTVADLLRRCCDGNLSAAATLVGQPPPGPCDLAGELAGDLTGDLTRDLTGVVTESIRTVLTVAAGLTSAQFGSQAGSQPDSQARSPSLAPAARDLLWQRTVELTVLGYDLQQAIKAGAGLDDVLVDRLLMTAPSFDVWPHLDPLDDPWDGPYGATPTQRFLALTGRPAGLWVDTTAPDCASGSC